MRVEITIAVLSVYCLAEAYAMLPPWNPFCESGVIGPDCVQTSDCKINYTCIAGSCCRDPMCPEDMIEGNQCILTIGKTRCEEPFRCIDDFCCRDRACPKGTMKVGKCQRYSISRYGGRPRCPRGAFCHEGLCCKSIPKPDLCPRVKRKPSQLCPQYFANPDECGTNGRECETGLCCNDECGVKRCTSIPIFQRPG